MKFYDRKEEIEILDRNRAQSEKNRIACLTLRALSPFNASHKRPVLSFTPLCFARGSASARFQHRVSLCFARGSSSPRFQLWVHFASLVMLLLLAFSFASSLL